MSTEALAQQPASPGTIPGLLYTHGNEDVPDLASLSSEAFPLMRDPEIVAEEPDVERVLAVVDEAIAQGGDRQDIYARIRRHNSTLKANEVMRGFYEHMTAAERPEGYVRSPVPPDAEPMDDYIFADSVFQAVAMREAEITDANRAFNAVVSDIMDTELNCSDVLPDAALRSDDLGKNAQTYAKKLARLRESGEWEAVEFAAQDIRSRFEETRALLPPTVRDSLSPFADSRSWIMWDIGKMEALQIRPGGEYGSYNAYNTGTALEPPRFGETSVREIAPSQNPATIRQLIADRHMGWEVFAQVAAGTANLEWVSQLPVSDTTVSTSQGDEAWMRRERQTFLDQVARGEFTKADGQLPSHVYTRLGSYISQGLDYQRRAST